MYSQHIDSFENDGIKLSLEAITKVAYVLLTRYIGYLAR